MEQRYVNKNDPGYLCPRFAQLWSLETDNATMRRPTVLLDDEHAPPYVMYRHLSFRAHAVFLVGRERVVHQPDIAIEARIVAISELLLAPRHDLASPKPQMRPKDYPPFSCIAKRSSPAKNSEAKHLLFTSKHSHPARRQEPRRFHRHARCHQLLLPPCCCCCCTTPQLPFLKLLTCFSVHLPVLYCDCCLTYNNLASDFVRDRASSISTEPSHRCGSRSFSLQLPGSIRHFRTTFSPFVR